VTVQRRLDQEACKMISQPLPVLVRITREMAGIEGGAETVDEMTVDDGGRHRQKTVADRETPNGPVFDMGETSKEEGSQTIHQHFSWIVG
jgi:hypothetical protein